MRRKGRPEKSAASWEATPDDITAPDQAGTEPPAAGGSDQLRALGDRWRFLTRRTNKSPADLAIGGASSG